MMSPTFSVILPCHNAAAWIGQAMNSAAAQTHAPFEIIVINDASTDETATLVRQSRVEVTLLQTDFRNAAAARNAGANIARGDFLAFLDADDYWLADHLALAAALLGGSDDVGCTGFHDELFEAGRMVRAANPFLWDQPTSALTHQDYVRTWMKKIYTSNITTLVRRDRFNAVGGFDETQLRRHDFELWLRVIYGQSWSVLTHATAVCRADTPNSISRASAADSAFYALRGMRLNEERYASTGFARLVQRVATWSMATALMDGTPEQRRRIAALARPCLSPIRRTAFAAAAASRPLSAPLIRRRRNWIRRRRGEVG